MYNRRNEANKLKTHMWTIIIEKQYNLDYIINKENDESSFIKIVIFGCLGNQVYSIYRIL